MTDTRIPTERVKELLAGGVDLSDSDEVCNVDFTTGSEMTWGELRALLTAYGRECEWKYLIDDAEWETGCGGGLVQYRNPYCPMCGGKVKTC